MTTNTKNKVMWIENSATSCQLKWTWSKLYLQTGMTHACWHNPHHEFTELENFHNTPQKISDREAMLRGEWPAGCGYCKNIEQSGGTSDRMLHNLIPNMRPVELDSDPNATHIDPTVMEIIFSNVCNMSCIYCGPGLSSVWNNEVSKYGDLNVGDRYSRTYKVYDKNKQQENVDKFWAWMEKKSNSLTKLTALGGEPLLEENTYKLLDFFDSHPNNKMQLLVFTNLMIPREKLELVLVKLSKLVDEGKIGSAQISTSMEAYGPSAEYIRYGVELGEWENNLKYIKNFPNVDVIVNGTVICLSTKTMPDMIRRLKEFDIPWYFSGVDRVPFLELSTLPANLLIDEIDEAIELLDDWSANRLRGIKSTLSPTGNLKRMAELKQFLIEMDRRRNLDWKKTFPWLVEVLDVV